MKSASYAVSTSVFERLHIKRVVNGCGIYTDLGGSILSPSIWSAIEELNGSFVSMTALLDATGSAIAARIGVPGARVTPGASAAIALGTAACMTGMNGDAWERLPDTTGLRDRVLIQAGHRYKYDRCARLTGASLTVCGTDQGTSEDDLTSMLDERVAMILVPGHLDGCNGSQPLEVVARLGRERGIPTMVDAAYLNYPVEIFGSFMHRGADLACFSAKYFGGPNAGGFICGRTDLLLSVAGVDFTGFESGRYRTFGRAFKLDRYSVAATALALDEWLDMNHAERWQRYANRVDAILAGLGDVRSHYTEARHFTMDERLIDGPSNAVVLRARSQGGSSPEQLAAMLLQRDPAIAVIAFPDALVIGVDALTNGQDTLIAAAIREILGSAV